MKFKSYLRWHAKKLARKGLSFGSWAAGTLRRGTLSTMPTVRVLTYHRFGDLPYDPFCVSAEDLAAQMAFLAENRLALSLEQFHAYLTGRASVPKNAVLVTIDDGFRSLLTVGLPIFERFRIPFVAFITPEKIGTDETQNSPVGEPAPEPYLTWPEVEALTRGGGAVGAHGLTHRSLGRMPVNEAEHEALRAREILEQQLGLPAKTFAYPFGTLADFNDITTALMGKAGYSYAFTSQHGAIRPGLEPLCLPRIKVEGGENLKWFKLLVRGGMDHWSIVDKTLWKIQASQK